jgi:hypothetical protein
MEGVIRLQTLDYDPNNEYKGENKRFLGLGHRYTIPSPVALPNGLVAHYGRCPYITGGADR